MSIFTTMETIMIKYEIKKIISSKILIFILIGLLILNLAQIIYKTCPDLHGSLYTGKQKILEKVEGKITQEKYDFLVTNYKETQAKVVAGDYQTDKIDDNTYSGYVFGDNQLFYTILEEYDQTINYQDYLKEVIDTAKENIKLTTDSSFKQYNKELLYKYQERTLSYYYDYTLIEYYINHDFSYLLSLVMVIMVIVQIFLSEKQNGTIVYYDLVRNGKQRVLLPKIIVLLLMSIIISLLFSFENFIVYYFLGANKGWLQPLYALENFRLTSSQISIAFYIIINSCLQIVGCILFASIMMTLCRFFNYSYQGIIAGIITIILSIISYNYYIFSIIDFSSTRDMFVTDNIFCHYLTNGLLISTVFIILNYLILKLRNSL